MHNIIITPLLHKMLPFENNGWLEDCAISTDGYYSHDIFVICTTLFVLSFDATATNYMLCSLVRGQKSTLIHAIDVMRKDILVNYILLHKIKPQLYIGWV